jgi:predicted patatin/cPLA2 family phospholipase
MAQITLFGTRPEAAIANIRARAGKDRRNAGDGRKLALVVEGGAMRGAFSCGSGVALQALGLTNAFEEIYACSSGALNAAYFVADQAAYSVSIYYDHVNNRQFINPLCFKNILDMDFLFGQVLTRRRPLDVERALASPSRLLISITDAKTGTGFLADSKDRRYALLDMLRASATHPLLSERSFQLGDRDCFDGGFANPLPIKDALAASCTDILLLLTRPFDYVDPRPGFLMRELFRWRCARGNATLVAAGQDIHIRENQARDLATGRTAPPPGVNIIAICPDAGTRLSRTMTDRNGLIAAAAAGARQLLRAFDGDPSRLDAICRDLSSASPTR